MNWRKKLLESSRLCVIIDKNVCGAAAPDRIARELLVVPRLMFQLRDKTVQRRRMFSDALSLRAILPAGKTLFIINDYPDIAMMADADGVHLGQQDLPIARVRRLIGRSKLIGLSCATLKEAMAAQKAGADYVGIGPVFATSTKTDARVIGRQALARVARRLRIPVFAIGGIALHNLDNLLGQGVRRVAVCQALCLARNKKSSVEKFHRILNSIP